MKTNENQKTTNHQPGTQKPFFGAAPEQAFFSSVKEQSTPFFQRSATSKADVIGESVVQRMPAFESEVKDNGAVQRKFVNPSPIQAKLTIGEPGDKYEQEADRVASQVVEQINAPAPVQSNQGQSVQRQEEKKEELQAKPDITALQRQEEKPEELQAKFTIQRREDIASGEASPDLTSAINSARGGGQSLDAGLQRSMGQAMGADFSGVRVHTDAQSDQLNRSIQAKAFTTGQDVFFRQGAYEPGSRGGQELIAHELTHVLQQNGRMSIHSRKQEAKPASNLQKLESLGHVLSTDAISKTETNQVQRAIGFEFQTKWEALTMTSKGKTINLDSKDEIYRGEKIKIETDSKQMEFITDPLSTYEQVEDAKLELVGVASDLFRYAQTHTQNNRFTKGPHEAWASKGAGWKGQVVIQPVLSGMQATPQATEGVMLSQVPSLIETAYGQGSQDIVAMTAQETGVHDPKRYTPNVQGLIRAISMYIHTAANASFDWTEGPKTSFPLMARTDFHSMYELLDPAEKGQFREYVGWDASRKCVTCFGAVRINEVMFKHVPPKDKDVPIDHYTDLRKKFKIADWLTSIITASKEGKDTLSPPPPYLTQSQITSYNRSHPTQTQIIYAMGSYGTPDGRTLFERRDPTKQPKDYTQWPEVIDRVREEAAIRDTALTNANPTRAKRMAATLGEDKRKQQKHK